MRNEDGIDHDDDAPFGGGSTEQKDAWLQERARQRDAYYAAMAVAQARLNAPDAELLAWATPITAGRTFGSSDVYEGYLLNARRALVGPLGMSETFKVRVVAKALWQQAHAPRGARVA